MDPLSGAGLAGTVVQFVQFAANLFSVAKEIHRSASGSSEGKESLEAIYTRLSTLSSNLQKQGQRTNSSDGTQPDEAVDDDAAMGVLAKECKVDCDRLLSVLGRLNNGHGSFPKWWQSFRSALKELWKGDEIETLEARITKHQTQLIMHLYFWNRVKTMQDRIEEIYHMVIADAGRPAKPAPSREFNHPPDTESLSRQISKLSLDDMNKFLVETLFSDKSELRELASLSEMYAKTDDILQTIDYEHRTARHDSIPQAYPRTFEWVFEKGSPQENHLLEWLEKGSEIFWITGKPGAGKSTFIKFVADSPKTKTALRKWAVDSKPLIKYFGNRPTMSIHELTRDDIRNFAQHELSGHPKWGNLTNGRGERDGMVIEIVQRAQGVFLWVVLVVRQLREGLTNCDTSKDLWKRLDRIPDGLTMFFRHMIESVEDFYLQKMAESLLIAAAGQGPLHSAIYMLHDRGDANPNYAIEEPLIPWTDEQLANEVRPCPMRLNSRCKGLLEVDAFDRVNFLHRTVRDFLQMEEMRGILKNHAISGFDAELSIFQAYICWIKHSAFVSMGGIAYYGPSKSLLVDTLETALAYAGKSDSPFILDLIDDLDWTIHRMFDTGQATFAGTETIQQTQHLFRTCILRTGLDDYSIKRLVREPQYLQGLEVPPLVFVLKLDTQDENDHEMRWSARRVNLLQNLLDQGHDPNDVYVDPESGIETSPWCELAKRLMPCPQLEQNQLPSDYPQRPLMEAESRGVISMLLDHGADPNALFEGEDSPEPLPI
ncbi:hypothetical protein SLS64_007320 [Diaporthe eres]